MITLNNVSKEVKLKKNIKLKIIKDVNLHIEKNDFLIIYGKSGSGKSTLINIISGVDYATEGEYLFENKKIANERNRNSLRRNDVGIIIQNYALIGEFSVYKNIALARNDRNKINELVKLLEIDHLIKTKCKYLSGGEKQRVAIARALVKEPKLIVADEPTGSVDSKSRDIIMSYFKKIHQEGRTIVLVTHDESLRKYALNTVELNDGKLVG